MIQQKKNFFLNFDFFKFLLCWESSRLNFLRETAFRIRERGAPLHFSSPVYRESISPPPQLFRRSDRFRNPSVTSPDGAAVQSDVAATVAGERPIGGPLVLRRWTVEAAEFRRLFLFEQHGPIFLAQ